MKLITVTFAALGLAIATIAQAAPTAEPFKQASTPVASPNVKVAQMAPIRCYQVLDRFSHAYYTVCR